MAKSLANFIVGIGSDVTGFKDGMKEVNSGMLGVRTGALAAGAALATALTAVTGIAISTAKNINELDLQMQYSDASIQYAYNFGNAVERMGGQSQQAYGEIINMQKALNAFQREGERGKLESVAILGIDPSSLFNLENDLVTFQSRLADIVKTARPEQKLGIQEIFGLSDASMRLLEKGSIEMKVEMGLSEERTGNIEVMVEDSKDLVNEWVKLKEHAVGFNNEISKKAIPVLTEMVKSTNVGVETFNIARKKEVDTTKAIQASITVGLLNMFRKDEPVEREEPQQPVEREADAPSTGGFVLPQMLLQQASPEVTHVQNNSVTNQTITDTSIKQPIQIQNHITTTVELDKRQVGKIVTEFQEEEYFKIEQGLKGTTYS